MSTIDWVAGVLVLVFFIVPSGAILINMHMEARCIDREYKERLAAHGIKENP